MMTMRTTTSPDMIAGHATHEPATVVLVCTRCRSASHDPGDPRCGAALLEAVQDAARGDPTLRVQGVACMSGCTRGCVAAVLGADKVGYLFGDLAPDASSAADLLRLAQLHDARPDGFVARADRPERLRAGIIGRLPPVRWIASAGPELAWPAR
jgi:predicted metal-binding protein